ncbi:MAG: hypothetical protein FWF51_12500 [Chitinivibrionia bacterium]|nr:hypothetical protein [Chitinivibrionia bacterium]
MLRFSNKGKEALGGLFLNLCALTYAGVVLDGIFGDGVNVEHIIYGGALAVLFSFIGIFLIEKSNSRWG